MKQHIGTSLPDSADSETMKLEVEQLREKNKELEDEVAALKEKVCCVMFFSVLIFFLLYLKMLCFSLFVNPFSRRNLQTSPQKSWM